VKELQNLGATGRQNQLGKEPGRSETAWYVVADFKQKVVESFCDCVYPERNEFTQPFYHSRIHTIANRDSIKTDAKYVFKNM
jgi:hypothetical protein